MAGILLDSWLFKVQRFIERWSLKWWSDTGALGKTDTEGWGTNELHHKICFLRQTNIFPTKFWPKHRRMRPDLMIQISSPKTRNNQQLWVGDLLEKREIVSLWKWSSGSNARAMELLWKPVGRCPAVPSLVNSILLLLRVGYGMPLLVVNWAVFSVNVWSQVCIFLH